MEKNLGRTEGHLPMENSRTTKFLLDREARINAKLTSYMYCVSPLVQGGLEIPCWVQICMASSSKKQTFNQIYTYYVDLLYCNRRKSNTVGTCLIGEMNALSASSNKIGDGKTKARKERVQFLTRRDPKKIYARSSQRY